MCDGRRFHLRGKLETLLTVGIGLVLGAIAVNYVVSSSPSIEAEDVALIDTELRLAAGSLPPGLLQKGWRKPGDWGTWMKDRKASLALLDEGQALGDIEIVLEGRVDLKPADPPTRVEVRFNGADIGDWPMSSARATPRRRFIVAQEIYNRTTPAVLALSLVPAETNAKFGLSTLSVKDAKGISSFSGHLDSCREQKLTGWAVADGLPVPVVVTVDGKRVEAKIDAVIRPDLEQHGYPADAGFEITLADPVAAGSEVGVSFYGNGRPLVKSPCKY